MPRKRPYFPLHRITTGKYTKGGEYVLENGSDYIGPYHILPNGWLYSGFIPHSTSVDLYDIDVHSDKNIKYMELTSIKTFNYISPVYTLPQPSIQDYNNGYFVRYFVQKRSNPIRSIIEINYDQYTTINKINGPGINGYIWNSSQLKWHIRGHIDSIKFENQRSLNLTESTFSGISNYITNLIEFFK